MHSLKKPWMPCTKYAIAKFRGAVHVKPIKAYKDLIKEIKEASTSFVPDLSSANEEEVFASILNPTGLYFPHRCRLQAEDRQRKGVGGT